MSKKNKRFGTGNFVISKHKIIHREWSNHCKVMRKIEYTEDPWALIKEGYSFCPNCCPTEHETELDEKRDTLLESLGFESMDQFYELLYNNDKTIGKILEEKSTGYQEEDLYSEFHHEYVSEGRAYLIEVNKQYAVYEVYSGNCDPIFETDLLDMPTFDSYDKAKQLYDHIHYEKPLKEQIEDLKNALPEYANNIYVDVKYRYCNIKYKNCLLIEKTHGFNVDGIRKEIERFEKITQKLEESNMDIISIYKRKEFPGNQRFYVLEYYKNDEWNICESHIKSMYQNVCDRKILDFFEFDDSGAVHGQP